MKLPLQFRLFLTLLLATGGLLAQAQQTFFEPVPQARVAASVNNIRRYSVHRLQETSLRTYLANAPLEFQAGAAPLNLTLPMPDGTTETFAVSESPVLSPEVSARHPEIKTYAGTGKAHPAYALRLSLTSSGFDAIVLNVNNDAVYITKSSGNAADRLYLTYFSREVAKPEAVNAFGSLGGKCGTVAEPSAIQPLDKQGRKGGLNNTGTSLRTFRLAVAATKEFTARRGVTRADAYNAVVGYVNRMNAVYRQELSVAFTLISDVALIYGGVGADANPVPFNYTNANTGTSSDENQVNLDNLIGNANYDVGHLFGYSGGSGEGVAVTPSVCITGSKANGTSNVGNTSYGPIDPNGAQFAPVYDDQLISHEIGHQFGMSHTFNSVIPVCTTREPGTSVEPGSGSTIMSYGFTCAGAPGNDDYEASYQPFLNFHTVSYQQAATYISTLTCFTATALTNAVPVIAGMPTDVVIPKSTPFELSATATDADNNPLSYQWEGTNTGGSAANPPTPATLLNTALPPFFRSYPPTASNTRIFPRLSAILGGTNTARGDKLPSVGIATTHRFIVRDGVGGLTYQQMTVTTDDNSGPFLITGDLTATYAGNSSQTINWDVANTTAAPINAANVDIMVSTDGGLTFTTVLANTPNDGTEAIVLPNVATTTARVKVKASNNIFFDISNTNFGITASAMPVELVYFRAEPAADQVRLSWQTASERNNDRFEVQRSRNLSEFATIGRVAADGESMQVRSYGLNDAQPLTGTSYYRLAQVDRDGTTTYSKAVAVVLDPLAPFMLVVPNPATPTQIRYRIQNLEQPVLGLTTLAGRPVGIQSVMAEGAGTYLLKPAEALPAGVYILKATAGTVRLSERVVVVD